MTRFRDRRNAHQRPPEVNLIPMLDVLMTVLTFFIIVSMTLGIEQGIEVQLPSSQQNTPAEANPDPLIAKLALQGLTVADRPVAETQLMQQIRTYLAGNPKGVVVLQAAPDVPYEQVITLLGGMKAIGGDRISLAIE
ncbi:biopolymer transporter ExbD [Phormidium tenue FACHB-886]|nr:biopolymer transporter ExbD [Phormidium tenue FACHB-886]